MLAATSTGFEPEALLLLSAGEPILDWLMSAVRKNTQHPVKHSNSQAKPPNFVLVGEPAKISANKAKAIVGKGRRNNEYFLLKKECQIIECLIFQMMLSCCILKF